MSKIYNKVASSFSTIVMSTGLAAYTYLIYHKFKTDRKLSQPVVKEVLEQIKNTKEVTDIVGHQFVISTGLLKSLNIKTAETQDSMEYSFPILGTKGITMTVYFSAIAKNHKDIRNSPEWEILEAEYYLPTSRVEKIITEAQNKDHLQNLIIEDGTPFWKVEYIEGIPEKSAVIDVKTNNPDYIYAPKVSRRNTYFDVYKQLHVN